jgi:hypothetical protein
LQAATAPRANNGNLLEVRVNVVNDGNSPLALMGPDDIIYNEDGTGWRNSECGKWRIGVDFADRPSGMNDHPYRFGRDETLSPGTVRTLGGYIRLNTPRANDFWVGVVQECNHWEQDNSGRTRITVAAEVVITLSSPTTILATIFVIETSWASSRKFHRRWTGKTPRSKSFQGWQMATAFHSSRSTILATIYVIRTFD